MLGTISTRAKNLTKKYHLALEINKKIKHTTIYLLNVLRCREKEDKNGLQFLKFYKGFFLGLVIYYYLL